MYRSPYIARMSDRLYKILGASPSSTDEELRSIYRKRVRAAHPDVCGATKENVQRFLEIQEAYDKLVELRRKKPSRPASAHKASRPSAAPAYVKPRPSPASHVPESDDFIDEMFDTLSKDLGTLASRFLSIFKFR